ncbi:tRNA (adenosine(37)-N6)-threonylcarbamoyltransferase complex dimerization subunit type 1 TsaB [Neomegalonema sp.]|uniref:tRNA (adenosine(37)-N6)-threonylcarbamoyltransferase complex dimerization subunit type 1 TsaB n=1 Tax=Neomegalonema sp. TaxID=2039713 RepID=UPI002610435E|nr:tRNA (adenosine(37)-N6)-threonylcarbamoyltransferase complex dimerization subunit type 1 TsaB [Neomegalonema sp.]MDD2868754.1 tRNA (adenosine(37)-N6)-threonylcarbamoyltransferase complex dimerization subunit type 1 TsaB [Neomegalonema sp.]
MSLILVLDAASSGVSAALFEGEAPLALRRLDEDRAGEGLAPLVAELFAETGRKPQDLALIATTTGPGSFVGARIGPAFARGLALATGARAVGISVLEALAEGAGESGPLLVALDARRDALYLQAFRAGAPLEEAREIPLTQAPQAAPGGDFALTGSGAALWLAAAPEAALRARRLPEAFDLVRPEALARIALRRAAAGESAPPSPLYLRPPDAKPPADAA